MAILSKQIGWSQESNLLWEILKQLNRLTGLFKPKYKIYTALLTQSGGDNYQEMYDGSTQIGVTYTIVQDGPLPNDYDFTGIGAPNNDLGTTFVATGINPVWGTGGTVGLQYNTGAPFVTVLENTIGNIWFTYSTDGLYNCYSNGLFTDNKTFLAITQNNENDNCIFKIHQNDNYSIDITSNIIGDSFQNNLLYNTPIEIRVYN